MMKDLIQTKADSVLDQYARQLVGHFNQYGFCGEFIESGFEPKLEETRLLCQCRGLFFFLDYANLTGDDNYIDLAFELYIIIQAHYFNEPLKVWGQYPNTTDNTLYEYAFLLLAFTKLYQVRENDALKEAMEHVEALIQKRYIISLDDEFAHLKEPSGLICQNALMHLFEAYLEVYKVFQTKDYLSKVEGLLEVLLTLFYSEKLHLISEYHPIDNELGIFEPGHSFEWAALLYEAEALGIQLPAHISHKLIVASAEDNGVIDHKLVVGQLKGSSIADRSRFRIWPLFERLRYYAMTKDWEQIELIFNPFIALFFDSNGFPIEYLNEDLKADFPHIKTTTAYHLINCFKYLF